MLGEVIHGYRVDRALSVDKGGMGDVFFATHVESGADAVVKVLKPEMSARRDIVVRFFNEARAAASIHHPGIVQIHNVGYHGDRAYLLMERLRGDDLENRLKAGPLSLDRAIVFMRQAAGAIAAAHERGIVHRDLKPANLFVVPDPDVVGGERVKVLDFGIAKLSLDTGGNKTQGIFGTPAYMSPEQCASSGDVDLRSDLYALGCIFYELVTGRPPFGHGGIELVAAHLRDTPPPPRSIAPWVAPAVEHVIMQLLAKQPHERPPSCAALITELDGIAATLPPAARSSMPHSIAPHVSGPTHAAMSSPPAHSPTTLGSAAGAMATAPMQPARGRTALWIGLAVVVAGGAVAAALVASSGGGNNEQVAAATAPTDGSPTPTPTLTVDAAETPPPPPAPAADPAAEAQTLNETGKAALYDDRVDDAIAAFTRAALLDPSPNNYFNLGVAHSQAGHCEEARLAVQQVLGDARADGELRDKSKKMLKQVGDCAAPPSVGDRRTETRPQPTQADPPKPTQHDPQRPTQPDPKPQPTQPDPKPQPTQPDPQRPQPPGGGIPVVAGTPREQASQLNDAGKVQFGAGNYADALRTFRRAVALDPLPKYMFNVEAAHLKLGQCAEARLMRDKIVRSGADAALKEKAEKLLAKGNACAQ